MSLNNHAGFMSHEML